MTETGVLDGENGKRYVAAIKADATDLFLVPEFRSTRCFLYYHECVLDTEQLPCDKQVLRRSGVVRNLLRTARTFGGLEREPHLWILGDLVEFRDEQWFLARELRVDDGEPENQAPLTRIMQLHLLHGKGFHTVLPLCSWLAVIGVGRDGAAITRDLPKRRREAVTALTNRVHELQEVLRGERRHYWESSTLFRHPGAGGYAGRRLPVKTVTGVEIAEATGIEFEEQPRPRAGARQDLPRLW